MYQVVMLLDYLLQLHFCMHDARKGHSENSPKSLWNFAVLTSERSPSPPPNVHLCRRNHPSERSPKSPQYVRLQRSTKSPPQLSQSRLRTLRKVRQTCYRRRFKEDFGERSDVASWLWLRSFGMTPACSLSSTVFLVKMQVWWQVQILIKGLDN